MRKYIALIIMMLSVAVFAFAVDETEVEDSNDFWPMTITFSAGDTIYAGFSTRRIGKDELTPILNTDKYAEAQEISFDYDDNSKSYITDTFYAYAQVFTSTPVDITLAAGKLVNTEDSRDVLSWTNIASERYTAPIRDDINGLPSFQEDGTEVNKGRTHCFDIQLSVPFSTAIDSNATYQTTMRLKVKTR